jgi:hypothetical protein
MKNITEKFPYAIRSISLNVRGRSQGAINHLKPKFSGIFNSHPSNTAFAPDPNT